MDSTQFGNVSAAACYWLLDKVSELLNTTQQRTQSVAATLLATNKEQEMGEKPLHQIDARKFEGVQTLLVRDLVLRTAEKSSDLTEDGPDELEDKEFELVPRCSLNGNVAQIRIGTCQAILFPLSIDKSTEIHLVGKEVEGAPKLGLSQSPSADTPVRFSVLDRTVIATYRGERDGIVDIWNLEESLLKTSDTMKPSHSIMRPFYKPIQAAIIRNKKAFVLFNTFPEEHTLRPLLLDIPLQSPKDAKEVALNVGTPLLALDVTEKYSVVANRKGLHYYDLETNDHHHTTNFTVEGSINRLHVDTNGVAFISSTNGLWRLEEKNSHIVPLTQALKGLCTFEVVGEWVVFCNMQPSVDYSAKNKLSLFYHHVTGKEPGRTMECELPSDWGGELNNTIHTHVQGSSLWIVLPNVIYRITTSSAKAVSLRMVEPNKSEWIDTSNTIQQMLHKPYQLIKKAASHVY